MPPDNTAKIAELIQQITGGQPYVFMLMPFGIKWPLFEKVKALVRQEVGLNCIRADDIPGSGLDLLGKIHVAIQRAELVIAEISEKNSNVFYELGYSVGIQKPVLLLADERSEVPTDVRGLERIVYSEGRTGVEAFARDFGTHIRQRLDSEIAILRDMLEAERPRPVYITASPKYPTAKSRIPGQPYDSRTFGDNLGILGLLSAFGSVFGERSGIELVSAEFCPPDLAKEDVNLFLIGSSHVNSLVKDVLRNMQLNSPVTWEFRPAEGEEAKPDQFLSLYRVQGTRYSELKSRNEISNHGEVHVEDYGIILRSPHPEHTGRLIMVMAGAHSLGTGAACLAATRSSLIRKIKMKGIEISNRQQGFWVLVKGVSSERDGLLDVDGVSVIEAGVFEKSRPARA